MTVSGYDEWDEQGLSRLPSKAEVAGILFSRFLRKAALALVLLALGFTVMLVVPAYSVAGSDAYRAAREFVATNPAIVSELGLVTGCESVPTRYSVLKDEAWFSFVVYGEGTAGAAELWLKRDGVWRVTSGSFVQQFDRVGRGRVLHFRPEAPAPVGSR